MKRKIVGVTVGSPLPKSNLMQTDPTKGDYVKGREEFIDKIIEDSLGGTEAPVVVAAAKQEAINTANTYTDEQITSAMELVEF